MMSSALSSLLADEPFFSQELWPLHHRALSSLQEDWAKRKARLANGLLRELHQGDHPLPLLSSTLTGLDGDKQQFEEPEEQKQVQQQRRQQQQQRSDGACDLLVTLDARGYAPGDISVRVEGRRLAVVATKQAGTQESQTCSSSSSRAAFCAAASSQTGFVQKIELPPHLDLSGLSCSLMDDGQLRIHAPVAQQAVGWEQEAPAAQQGAPTAQQGAPVAQQALDREQEAPALFRSSLEFPITKDKTEEEFAL